MSEGRLEELALSVHADLEPIAEGKRITLTVNAAPATLTGMPDALRLLIANLTDNAIRYTPEGGRIEISVATQGESAVIAVADSGPGIAPEERERVFERFYRALGTKVSGTGLGLAIVQRIVQLHSGEIRIEDGLPREDGTGCGARFVVTLPLQQTGLEA
jgi:two-component system OmpR family sensor kinase